MYFQVFLTGNEDENGHFAMQYVMPVVWYGGPDFPPNEPLCGFTGKRDVCLETGIGFDITDEILIS